MKVPFNTELDINTKCIEETIASRLAKEVMNLLRDTRFSYSGKSWSNEMNEVVEKCTTEFLNENKDIIIEETTKSLTKRLANTKVVKEKLNELVADMIKVGSINV